MKNQVKLIFLFLSFSFYGQSQNLDFIKSADNGHSALQKIRSTSDDRIFAIGHIFGQTVYDGVSYQSSGVDDIFLASFNAEGSIDWLITAGSPNEDDRPIDMVIDEENEFIYITGTCGEGAAFEQTIITYVERTAFLAKYDFDGNLIWVITPGELGGVRGVSLDLDDLGNIYLTGEIEDEAIFGNTIFVEPSGTNKHRFFLASYSPTATQLWAKEIKGHPTDCQLNINNQGDLLLVGSFRDSITIDNNEIAISTAVQEDLFIALLDLQGQSSLLNQGTGVTSNYILDVISDSNGNFLLAGWSDDIGSMEFPQYTIANGQNYVLTFNPNSGTVINNMDIGQGFFTPFEIFLTPNEHIISTGKYSFMAELNGAPLPLQYTNDLFLIGYNENENPDWYFTGNGQLNDIGTSMCMLSNGDLLLAGYFSDTMWIENEYISTGLFDVNLFLAKISEVEETVGIEKTMTEDTSWEVLPNPASTHLEIQTDKEGMMQIFDLTGRMLKELQAYNNVMINISDFVSGTYFVRFGMEVKKLIVLK